MSHNTNQRTRSNQPALQDDDDDDGDFMEAYMFQANFRPSADFVVVSEQIEWAPTPPEAGEQPGPRFNFRMIQYVGNNQFAFLFPYEDANVEQGVRYQLAPDFDTIAENEALANEGMINVRFRATGAE